MTFDSIISTSNPLYANFSTSINKINVTDTAVNVYFEYFQDVTKFTVKFKLSIPKDKNDQNYEKVLLDSATNVCKMAKGIVGDFLVKMIMEDFSKFADFNITCPWKKVCYSFRI